MKVDGNKGDRNETQNSVEKIKKLNYPEKNTKKLSDKT